jgi:DNA polymerase zeta
MPLITHDCFVGRSKETAFKIGREIAETITKMSPPEVVLKFEKVYYPCILASKKRYVGASYEEEEQDKFHLDAKVW